VFSILLFLLFQGSLPPYYPGMPMGLPGMPMGLGLPGMMGMAYPGMTMPILTQAGVNTKRPLQTEEITVDDVMNLLIDSLGRI
jgi:hypothetical protein